MKLLNLFDFIETIEPKYRREQVYLSLFNNNYQLFSQATNIPKDLKIALDNIGKPNLTCLYLSESQSSNTFKAILGLSDGQSIESVLMGRISKKNNSTLRYTVCISTQVGCPMKCAFCSTGSMSFIRNLSAEEIVAQVLYWQKFLSEKNNQTVDNIVIMGQGEPLLNYEAVKKAINLLIKYGQFGPRKITLSTAGIESGMQKMISDSDFPPIRFALSLHSAIADKRSRLMPVAQTADFFDFLIKWSKLYHRKWPSRTHFIGIEYLLMENINDTDEDLKALIKLLSKIGRTRINLIPLNMTIGNFKPTEMEKIKLWQKALMDKGYIVTIRLSQGQDISAACGQLKNIYDQDKKIRTK